MTAPQLAPFGADGSPFKVGEPIWALRPDGPRYGQLVWDLTPLITRTSQSSRRIDLTAIPDGYLADVADILLAQAQPDHPALVGAGVVRRADPSPTSSVYSMFLRLRTIAAWAIAHDLASFADWRQRDCDDLLADLLAGTHREDGYGLAPDTIRPYVETLKLVRDCSPVLRTGGLTFMPWGARTAADVAQHRRSAENLTAPLPWDLWAPLVAASWLIVDRLSGDIIEAVQKWRAIPEAKGGVAGSVAWPILQRWASRGGKVPLRTGFGRGNQGRRGEVNRPLLCRLLGLNHKILDLTSNDRHQPEAIALVERLAATPGRSVFGGLTEPTALVAQPNGTETVWIDEMGLGEVEWFSSILRAACYVLIGCLTGMRDSEIQDLTRSAPTTMDGLPALASVQHKGNRSLDGKARAWWAPEPAVRACQVLAELSPHPESLFARSDSNAGPYDSSRDLKRLVEFVNGDPATRPGRGAGLGLQPIAVSSATPVHALSLRRSFAVYATTKAGAELGLGIQLGHSAWRMTSGYFSDSQQQAVKHMDSVRRSILRDQASALIIGATPVAGPAAAQITTFRAQIVTDPDRADRLAATLADRLHVGLTNDCMWNPATSGCGADRPHLADHVCVGHGCSNALLTPAHSPALADAIERIDAFLDQERGSQDLRDRMSRDRANLVRLVRELTPYDSTEA